MSETPPTGPGSEPPHESEQPSVPPPSNSEAPGEPERGPDTPQVPLEGGPNFQQPPGQDPYVAYPRQYYAMPGIRAWDFGAIGEAWQLIVRAMGLWLVNGLIYFIIVVITFFAVSLATPSQNRNFDFSKMSDPAYLERLQSPEQRMVGTIAILVLSIFLQFYLMASLHMALKQVDGNQPDWNDVFFFRGKGGSLLLVAILVGIPLAVVVRFIPCAGWIIAPFLFALVAFAGPLILDKGSSAIDAIRDSVKTMWPGFVIGGIILAVTLCLGCIGYCLCCVGSILTVPFLPAVIAVAYRRYFPLERPPGYQEMPNTGSIF